MNIKLNTNRPKVEDDEIERRKNFEELVKQFKEQSLADAKSKQRSGKFKKTIYTAVIAGVIVVCTITLSQLTQKKSYEKTITPVTQNKNISSNAKTKVIDPIVKDKCFSTYQINVERGGAINHKTGSKITIPPNAFVTKKGAEIKGEVQISYREIHTVTEQLASGIPMRYDSAGVKQNFEAAGMLEIKGRQGENEIVLKPGKKIEIEMVSQKTGSHFNLYQLDTNVGKWLCQGKDKVIALTKSSTQITNSTSLQKISSLRDQHKNEIQRIEEQISSAKTTDVVDSKSDKLPQLPIPPPAAHKSRKQFMLDVDLREFPELKSFEGCVFEVGLENKHYSDEFNSIQWTDIDVGQGTQPGKNYTLILTANYRKEKLIVYPVFTGKKLEEKQQDYEKLLTQYNVTLAERKAQELKRKEKMEILISKLEEEKRSLQKKLQIQEQRGFSADMSSQFATMNNKESAIESCVKRVFQISSFGIYNSDCARPFPMHTRVDAEFKLNTVFIYPNTLYLINHSDKMLYTFNGLEAEKLQFDSRKKNSLIIFMNDRLFVCDTAQFKLTKIKKNQACYNFTEINALPTSAEELKKIVNM